MNGLCNGFDEAWLSPSPRPVGSGPAGLVAFLRSGGPLFRALSLDGGASWSTPRIVAAHGVSPQAAVLRPHGAIALAYGRPGNYLSFSLDGGASFTEEWCAWHGMAWHSIA